MTDHPSPAELERDPPTPEVEAHLSMCVTCRVEQRLLRMSASRLSGVEASRERTTSALRATPPGGEAQGRYQLGERLGGGANGEVLRAWDPQLRRHVAAKVLRREGADATARFVAECQLAAQLEHPHILPVYDVGATPDGHPSLVMKEIHGRSLAAAVREGALPTRVARIDALRKICDGVSFAHHRGVLHRDLKPENTMVGEHGEILVTDWGLARPLHATADTTDAWADRFDEAADRTREGQIAGTPAYMAPEQATGELARLDARTDVYALGGILFFLLVGRGPLDGLPVAEALRRLREGRVPRPRDVDPRVPRELDAVVAKAMAKDPDDRYPSARAMREDLDAWIERLPLPHVGSSRAERLAKFAARNRPAVLGVAATAGLALVALTAGAWWYGVQTGRARDAALEAAGRAERAEHTAVVEGAAARVALADSRIDQGREREAADALYAARASLVAAGADDRAVEMEFGRLFGQATPPLVSCRPAGDARTFDVAVAPDGSGAVVIAADGHVATWDPADCSPGPATRLETPLRIGGSATAWLADGPAAIALVGDDLLHVRPGIGVIARTTVPGLGDAVRGPVEERMLPRVGLHPDGTGWFALPDGAWGTLRFGSPAAIPERTLPKVPRELRLQAGGRYFVKFLDQTGGLYERATGRRLVESTGDDKAFSASSPGRAWVSSGGRMVGLDLPTLRERWTATEGLPADDQRLAPGDRRIVGLLAHDIVVHDAETGAFVAHAFTPEPTRGWAATTDARVVVAMVGESEVATMLPPARGPTVVARGAWNTAAAPVFSPDGEIYAHGLDDATLVRDMATGRVLRRLGEGNVPYALAFSPDGARLAVTMEAGLVVWDLASGEVVARREVAPPATAVTWMPDGRLLVGDANAELWGWRGDAVEQWARWDLGSGRIRWIGVLPGGAEVLVAKASQVDRVALATGAATPEIVEENTLYRGAVARDGRTAAIGAWAGHVRVWPVADPAAHRDLRVAQGAVWSADFSPDGSLVAAADWAGSLHVWDLATGTLLHTRQLAESTFADLRFSPDGREIWVRSGRWTMERVRLDARQGWEDAARGLRGSPAERARAFAAVGWWDRVIGALDAAPDDPTLRARALLATGDVAGATAVAQRAPPTPLLRILAAGVPDIR